MSLAEELKSSRPINSLPAVTPNALLSSVEPRRAFPFGDERTRWFYLGRGAVFHAVRALGLVGREVLIPAYHHGVEIEALSAAGAIPRFYGLDRKFRLKVPELEGLVGPRTAAVYVIHVAGFAQPMEDVRAFARRHKLKVIEDCALSLFSSDGALPLGSRADAAIYCLYKTIPVPNGGALWMREPPEIELADAGATTAVHQVASSMLVTFERTTATGRVLRRVVQAGARAARSVRPLPVDARPVGRRTYIPGQESLAISPVSLRIASRLDAAGIVKARRDNYEGLARRLRGVAPPIIDPLPQGTCPLFYPTWVEDKRALHAWLIARGIDAIDFWSEGSPLVRAGDFPDVDALRKHVLELPIHQDLDDDDLDRLAAAVRAGLRATS